MDKFDNFLQEATVEQAEQAVFMRAMNRLQGEADELLDVFDVETLFRFDDEARTMIGGVYIDETGSDTEMYDIEERLIRDQEMLMQMLQAKLEFEEHEDLARAACTKKTIIARMHIVEEIATDDQWMRFAEEFIPGEGLNFESVDDAMYIMEAQAVRDMRERQWRDFTAIMLRYTDQLVQQGVIREDYELLYEWAVDCIKIQLETNDNEPDREEKIEAVSRHYGFSSEIAREFVHDIDALYATE